MTRDLAFAFFGLCALILAVLLAVPVALYRVLRRAFVKPRPRWGAGKWTVVHPGTPVVRWDDEPWGDL